MLLTTLEDKIRNSGEFFFPLKCFLFSRNSVVLFRPSPGREAPGRLDFLLPQVTEDKAAEVNASYRYEWPLKNIRTSAGGFNSKSY